MQRPSSTKAERRDHVNDGGRDVTKSEEEGQWNASVFARWDLWYALGSASRPTCGRGDGGRAVLRQSVMGPAVAGLDAVRRAVELDRCSSPVGWRGGPGPGDSARLGAVAEHCGIHLGAGTIPLQWRRPYPLAVRACAPVTAWAGGFPRSRS